MTKLRQNTSKNPQYILLPNPTTKFFILFCLSIIIFPKHSFSQKLNDYIIWSQSLILEEPENIFTVSPEVRIDPEGGFIVSDTKESQVRLYSRSGKLRTYFGQKGQGPNDLNRPHAALRIDSNRIIVPQPRRISIFSEEGDYLESYPGVTAGQTYQVHDLPGEEILVVGARQRKPGAAPLLHRFLPSEGKIVDSFFPHPVPPGSYDNYLFTILELATADTYYNNIVASFAILPRLYFYDSNGNLTREIDVPLRHFRTLNEITSPPTSIEGINRLAETHSRISDIFWIGNNIILIQYFDFINVSSMQLRWNLAAVTPNGEVLFEITDTPQLFAVDPETGELFFSHPDHDFENHWIVGRLKPEVVQQANGFAR